MAELTERGRAIVRWINNLLIALIDVLFLSVAYELSKRLSSGPCSASSFMIAGAWTAIILFTLSKWNRGE